MATKPTVGSETTGNGTTETHPEFSIQRLYIKDISFESPQAPSVFKSAVQPSINVNISTSSTALPEGNAHEVVLATTVTAQQNNQNLFLIEVKQAGIFIIKNIPKENLGAVLSVTCPTILFPYLRETVTDLSTKGGFPHFYLSPINFEALYVNSLKQEQDKQKEKA